jgi:hypothetical protein
MPPPIDTGPPPSATHLIPFTESQMAIWKTIEDWDTSLPLPASVITDLKHLATHALHTDQETDKQLETIKEQLAQTEEVNKALDYQCFSVEQDLEETHEKLQLAT